MQGFYIKTYQMHEIKSHLNTRRTQIYQYSTKHNMIQHTRIASDGSEPAMADWRAAVKLSTSSKKWHKKKRQITH